MLLAAFCASDFAKQMQISCIQAQRTEGLSMTATTGTTASTGRAWSAAGRTAATTHEARTTNRHTTHGLA